MIRHRVGKNHGEHKPARTADQNWPEGYFILHELKLRNKNQRAVKVAVAQRLAEIQFVCRKL